MTGSDLPDPSDQFAVITNDYPAVVKVILPLGRGLCSGTFVSPRAVLTAAHCTQEAGTYTIISAFGTFTTPYRTNFGPGEVDDPNDISIIYFDEDVASFEEGQIMPIGNTVSEGEILRIIGYGCNDIDTRRGSGIKRTGTNAVYEISDYIEFLTPSTSSRNILGPENRAGSCFGDSGGPAAAMSDSGLILKGVAHAGGESNSGLVSEYIDITRNDNRNFLINANVTLSLGIVGL